MHLTTFLALTVAKAAVFGIRIFMSGAGSTWPGHVALKIDRKFVERLIFSSKLNVILVVGTNGKTTSSSMIHYLLKKQGKRAFRNIEGANLLNGIASTLVKKSSFFGEINYEYAIFEVDENNLPIVLQHVTPNEIVALNLFRDQLDRYGEVNTIADKWHVALEKLKSKTTLILNCDDPLIKYLGKESKHEVVYFDIPDNKYRKEGLSHDVDSIFCPVCGHELNFKKLSFSHLGKYTCTHCDFRNAKAEKISVSSYPLEGTYNIYNTRAAVLSVSKLLSIPSEKISLTLKNFQPAFGRGEVIEYKNREFVVLLAKNPASFNQSIDRILSKNGAKHIIIALNDRVPDGHDISWIWDVEFERFNTLSQNIYLTGDRVWDLAIRIQYSQDVSRESTKKSKKSNFKVQPYEKYQEAIDEAINNSRAGEKIYVLPTYSAMLEIRKILSGSKMK